MLGSIASSLRSYFGADRYLQEAIAIPLILSIMAIARIVFNHYSTVKRSSPPLNSDILKKIFEELDLKQLMSISRVCKAWQHAAADQNIIKRIIYQKHAINPEHWNHIFGQDTISSGEIATLPDNIFQILKSTTHVLDSHILAWIPKNIKGKPLSINNFQELLKGTGQFSEGYSYLWYRIVEVMGDKPMPSGFVLMSKAIIPGSLNKSPSEQKNLVQSLNQDPKIFWEIPHLGAAIVCIHLNLLKNGEYVLKQKPFVFIGCQEVIDDLNTIVGDFDKYGLYIGSGFNLSKEYIGACAIAYLNNFKAS